MVQENQQMQYRKIYKLVSVLYQIMLKTFDISITWARVKPGMLKAVAITPAAVGKTFIVEQEEVYH